ncbi:MAG TPA: protein kinase [Planctomycetota bacterium]
MGRKPGDVLGSYILEERVGGGPASEIWRASLRDGRAPAAAVRFFLRGRDVPPLRVGADVLRSLTHENIARVVEVDVTAADPYLLREWVPGRSLEGRALSHGEAGQVLRALSFAHARGVVHGRLAPSNVFAGTGVVKVADFGLAGSEDTPAADLRALGGLLPAGDPWGARLRAGEFPTAEAALAALPVAPPARMPSWIAGPLMIVGVFFIAYVAVGVTMATGLQPSLRLIAAAAGVGLCALAWRYVERPLLAAVFWGALLWGFGARVLSPWILAGAWATALAAGGLWIAQGRKRA